MVSSGMPGWNGLARFCINKLWCLLSSCDAFHVSYMWSELITDNKPCCVIFMKLFVLISPSWPANPVKIISASLLIASKSFSSLLAICFQFLRWSMEGFLTFVSIILSIGSKIILRFCKVISSHHHGNHLNAQVQYTSMWVKPWSMQFWTVKKCTLSLLNCFFWLHLSCSQVLLWCLFCLLICMTAIQLLVQCSSLPKLYSTKLLPYRKPSMMLAMPLMKIASHLQHLCHHLLPILWMVQAMLKRSLLGKVPLLPKTLQRLKLMVKWQFCTKCLATYSWVSIHQTSTHTENLVKPRKRKDA